MAWRIEGAVIRGEIDNRRRGSVVGRIWFAGRLEPVFLNLSGNAWRDLAGRRIAFKNPAPKAANLDALVSAQIGAIGDCTGSRRVKVPDFPVDLASTYQTHRTWSWHWANCLYLEWFSETNGRVVIESATFELIVDPDISWDMTAAEEEAQRDENRRTLERFMGLQTATDASGGEPSRESDWSGAEPLTEEAAEKIQEESDNLVDRIHARMQQEGPAANFQKILEEELERRQRERGEKPLTPEEHAQRVQWLADLNRAAEHPDDDEAAAPNHPLAEQALAASMRLLTQLNQPGMILEEPGAQHPVVDLTSSLSIAGAKLAGALNGCEWPPPRDQCAARIVRLKRAREHLGDALIAAQACLEKRPSPSAWLEEAFRETHALAGETERLITELRGRLERRFE